MDTDDGEEKTLALQANLQKFINLVDELQNEDDPSGDGFTREFRTIRESGVRMKEENTYPAEEGKKSCNIKKNRYRDILPFDETRVKLEEISGDEGSDYINANFIKNHLDVETYIACQGPLPHTVNDFWRMIMQYNVKVIAMACQTVEMGRKKCEQYWPSEDAENQTEQYGDVTVTLVEETELADNCVKRILQAVKDNKQQTVTQFHYTYWPDHDIPKDFDAILEMMAQMRQIRSDDLDKGPMLVHCSAGCGRTGTICAIDYSWEMLQTGGLTDEYSLFNIVMELRTQRQSMIQAPEQYMMAHVIIKQLFQKHLEMIESHTYGNVEFNSEGSIGGATDETSSISSEKSSPHKNSLLQEIEVTLKKVSGDDSSLTDSKSLTKEHQIPPISPIPEETVKSPGVSQMAAKFNLDKSEKITPPVHTLKSQTSVTNDGQKKHVTTISIGSKQKLNETKSQPAGNISNAPAIASNRAKTVPTSTNIKDKPQSSIPPTLPTQSTQNVYSYARNDQITATTAANSYSSISNYSSVKKNFESVPQHSYHVLERPGEGTLNGMMGTQSGATYSMAREPDNLYSMVQPKQNGASKINGTSLGASVGVYEAVQVGDAGPPPVPNRGYMEGDPGHQDRGEKPPLGAGDSHTLGRTKLFMSNFKNMFTAGKSHTGNDTNSPSDIPGFKEKIGTKPTGPRDPPWKKK